MQRFALLMTTFCLLILPANPYAGGKAVIPNYDTAREKYFWKELYPNAGKSLYCDIPVSELRSKKKHSIAHIYPASRIAEFYGCETRRNCEHEDFGRTEGDLHNLWPANRRVISSRGDLVFNEIDDEKKAWRFRKVCKDFEKTNAYGKTPGYVEPQDRVKGEIARSLFYMHTEYGLPLMGMLPMLKKWNKQDPVDDHERWRNDKIEEIQETRNPFIDDSTKADGLR